MRKVVLIINFFIACASMFAQQEKQLLPSKVKQITIVQEPITLKKVFFRLKISTSFFSQEKSFNDTKKKYTNLFNSTARS